MRIIDSCQTFSFEAVGGADILGYGRKGWMGELTSAETCQISVLQMNAFADHNPDFSFLSG